ncbi:MAG: hypothetical protein WA970_16775 [Gammaproteobacteria bacterium]
MSNSDELTMGKMKAMDFVVLDTPEHYSWMRKASRCGCAAQK